VLTAGQQARGGWENKETIPTHTQPRPRIAAVVQASRGGPASALGLRLVLCALRTGGADADDVRQRLQSGSLQANGRATQTAKGGGVVETAGYEAALHCH
jgi:hypothetical protein